MIGRHEAVLRVETIAGAAVWIAALAASAQAADPGRLDLLAREMGLMAASPGATPPAPAPWGAVAALVAGTMLAAFLGTFAGARRQLLRGGGDWRELTYRFRSGKPLHLKQDTLVRLHDLLGDLEPLGQETGGPNADGRSAREARRPAAPGSPPRSGRPAARERARRLLEEGYDPPTVRELTGMEEDDLEMLQVSALGTRR